MTARSAVARAGVVAASAAISLVMALPAWADGDPASDVLFRQTVFLPIGSTVSPPLRGALTTATRAARSSGEAIRVALIATPTDLGAIPSLFGRPTVYARFLGTELQFVYGGRLLIVMPQGVALSQRGQLLHLSAKDQSLRPGPSPDALGRAALTVIDHLVPATPAPRMAPKRHIPGRAAREHFRIPRAAKTPSSIRRPVPIWKATAISVAIASALLLVALPGFVWLRRRSLAREAASSFDPNDPYRYRGPD